MVLLTDPDDLTQETEITINETARTIRLEVAGNLSADGVTHQCVYSFLKEEWKIDATLIKFPFPIISITPEQFEWIDGWVPYDDTTRKLIRTGGWAEVGIDGYNDKEYLGIISLGDFEDEAADYAYYRKGTDPTLNDTTQFTYAGPVNEPVLIFEELGNPPTCTFASTTTITRASGDFVADGYVVGGQVVIRNSDTSANDGSWTLSAVEALTLTITGGAFTASGADTNAQLAYSYRNAISPYLRIRDADPEGKTFSKSTLAAIGISGDATYKVERFPLSNTTDLNIEETDANIGSNSPYTQINVKYFDTAFTMDIDLVDTERSFGIAVDVGTHSGVDGSTTASTLTSADGGIHLSNYDSGTLIVHSGDDKGTYSIVSTTATTIVISGTFPTGDTGASFTAQRASAVSASTQEIYEKVQYELRQTTDINELANGDVIGKVADELLEFVGSTLKTGTATPTNPNGGGSGVVILGFDSNDTNDLVFTDNGGTTRTFPYVAAGTINFNPNLVNDSGPAKYWMYFEYTTRTTVADLALSSSSGLTTSIDSALSNLPTLVQDDYVYITGFTNSTNDGLYQITDATPTAAQADATKVFPAITVIDESEGSRQLDQNPIDSPDAIIVDDNSTADITGNVPGASTSFDFDYDNNVQGGRTAATDAAVVLRAIGEETAQFIEASGTITRSTGLSFTLTASLERNYNNP